MPRPLRQPRLPRSQQRADLVLQTSPCPQDAIDDMLDLYERAVAQEYARVLSRVADARAVSVEIRVAGVGKKVATTVNQDYDGQLGIKVESGQKQMLREFRRRNVALIKNISEETRAKLLQTLEDSAGGHVKQIQAKLQQVAGVQASKARLWARDQTLKLHADLAEAKAKKLGITEYVWVTSHDGNVRSTHAVLDKRTFRYDDPPDTGTGPHNPGRDFQCRCLANPVIPGVQLSRKPKPPAQPPVQRKPKAPKAQQQAVEQARLKAEAEAEAKAKAKREAEARKKAEAEKAEAEARKKAEAEKAEAEARKKAEQKAKRKAAAERKKQQKKAAEDYFRRREEAHRRRLLEEKSPAADEYARIKVDPEVIARKQARAANPARAWLDGHAKKIASNIDAEVLADWLDRALPDEALTLYRKQPLRELFVSESTPEAERWKTQGINAQGLCYMDQGRIWLRTAITTADVRYGQATTIRHEMGHWIDQVLKPGGHIAQVRFDAGAPGAPTKYAKKDALEYWAESYQAWTVKGGALAESVAWVGETLRAAQTRAEEAEAEALVKVKGKKQ